MLSGQHRAAPPLSAVRRLTAALMIVGAVAHSGFLLEFFLDTALSPWHTLPAYLAVGDQPYRDVFRTVDWTAGCAFVLMCPPLLRIAPVHWLGRLTVVVIFATGVILLLRTALPLECVPVAAGPCDAPAGHFLHSSVLLPAVQYILGPVIVAAWWHGWWRVTVCGLLAVQLVTWTVVIVLGWLDLGWFTGLAVRVQLVACSTLLMVGAVYVLSMGTSRSSGTARRDHSRKRVVACPE